MLLWRGIPEQIPPALGQPLAHPIEYKAHLKRPDLTYADLSMANYLGADMNRTDMHFAYWHQAKLDRVPHVLARSGP